MISARTWSLDGKTTLEISGHSNSDASEEERIKVCAGVSALSLQLMIHLQPSLLEEDADEGADEEGPTFVDNEQISWNGDRSGYCRVTCSTEADHVILRAVLNTLRSMAHSYPGNIELSLG